MGFLRRIAGILGFSKDEPHETRDVDDDNDVVRDRTSKEEVDVEDIRLHRRGFSVPAQVSVERDRGPVLIPCTSGDGGVQVHSLSCLFACSGYNVLTFFLVDCLSFDATSSDEIELIFSSSLIKS